MKPDVNTWTIVVAGSWNAPIFDPTWVGEKLFGSKEFEIEFAFYRNNVFSSFKTSDIVFSPTNSQIVCGVRNINDNALTKAENLVVKTLDMLPYTPINAIGINFGFVEEHPQKNLLDLFNFWDSFNMSDSNYTTNESQIYRQIKIGKHTLNLRQTLRADEPMIVHLNFHIDVSDSTEGSKWLKDKVLECRTTAYQFLEKIYDLNNIEEENSFGDEDAA